MKKLILLALVSFSLNIHSQVELKYLGTAGWEISDDNITVLIDPYISRVKLGSGPSVNKLDKRKTVLRSDFFVSDSVVSLNQFSFYISSGHTQTHTDPFHTFHKFHTHKSLTWD